MTHHPIETRPRRGGGVALLFCVALGAAGLAFDLMRGRGGSFWVAADPGGRTALGIGVALFLVLAAYALRGLLTRRTDKGAGDAGDHP